MSEEKKDDYSDLSIGLGNVDDISHDQNDCGDEESFRIQMLKMEIDDLKGQLEFFKNQNTLNSNSLQLLISICKERNFDPFPGEDFPFKKPIKDLTKDELIAKNKEAAERLAKTQSVNSKDKTPMPPEHVISDKYARETPTLSESMEELLSKLPPPVAETVHPFERKVIFASCKDPYDPYSDER